MENKIDYNETAELIELHTKAYKLLLWLDRRAAKEPDILSAEQEAVFQDNQLFRQWIFQDSNGIPDELKPEEEQLDKFVSLFNSFFHTSFHIHRHVFTETLKEARIQRGHVSILKRHTDITEKEILKNAVKKLAQQEGLRLEKEQLWKLIKDKQLKKDIYLWSYIWELKRRANKNFKGPILTTLWQRIDYPKQEHLNVDRIWQSRSNILNAIKQVIKSEDDTE